jgi:hypothetical protein
MKANLKELRCEGVDWIKMTEDPEAGSCEHGNNPFSFIQGGAVLELLNDYQLLKKTNEELARNAHMVCSCRNNYNAQLTVRVATRNPDKCIVCKVATAEPGFHFGKHECLKILLLERSEIIKQ